MQPNFRENMQGELRRILLPRTWVNKGDSQVQKDKEKGRIPTLRPSLRLVASFLSSSPTSLPTLLACDYDGWLREADERKRVREASNVNGSDLILPVRVGALERRVHLLWAGSRCAERRNHERAVPGRELTRRDGNGVGIAMRLDYITIARITTNNVSLNVQRQRGSSVCVSHPGDPRPGARDRIGARVKRADRLTGTLPVVRTRWGIAEVR
jgi:hypothetical protein